MARVGWTWQIHEVNRVFGDFRALARSIAHAIQRDGVA
jgi:hypothetical protein